MKMYYYFKGLIHTTVEPGQVDTSCTTIRVLASPDKHPDVNCSGNVAFIQYCYSKKISITSTDLPLVFLIPTLSYYF